VIAQDCGNGNLAPTGHGLLEVQGQTIKAALDALQPPAEINLEAATKVLLDFGHAWENEPDRHKRNELLRQIFDRV
jgi:hypothetical protein